MSGAVAGVLFDSGDTLVRPVGGRWNPRLDFEAVLLRYAPDAPTERFPEAFAAGDAFLRTAPSTPARDDYHRVMLATLGVAATPDLLADLDRPLDQPVLEPFPETRQVLEALRARGLRMAIVSDNWLGAERLYAQLGLAEFFEAFITSAELGCNKPDPRMYRAGSDALGLTPNQCLFVDDDPDLVRAALDLGYRGAALVREGAPPADLPAIRGLDELAPLLG